MSGGAVRSTEAVHVLRLLVIFAVIFAALSLLVPDLFLTEANFRSMAFQFPEYGILALAMMLAMLTGGIDLSVVGTANLASILAAFAMVALAPVMGGPLAIAVGILVALAVGLTCGALNGAMIAGVGIPPILATLGTGLMFTGIGIVLTGGSAVTRLPGEFSSIGNGTLGSVPFPVLVFALLALALAWALARTKFGLRVYLLGTNPLASRFAGIDNKGVTWRTYVACGFLSACAGIVLASRANSAKADYGASYLLLAVLIAVLGGTNPYGGFGRVAGVVLAVLSLQMLSSGLNMLQFSNFTKELVWGLTLLLVMAAGNARLASLFGRTAPSRVREPVAGSDAPLPPKPERNPA